VSEEHLYRCRLGWTGSTGEGYESYSREHTVSAPPAETELRVSSDAAFRGDPRLLDPEQLLLIAASSCQLLSFLAVAARARLDVVAYEDEGEAVMPGGERPMRITRVLLRPRITLRGEHDEERLRHRVEVAHRHCFIANSLSCEMSIEPRFERA
jgi:organic hydroperoxide reductase OsmC/OhrA